MKDFNDLFTNLFADRILTSPLKSPAEVKDPVLEKLLILKTELSRIENKYNELVRDFRLDADKERYQLINQFNKESGGF